MFADMFTQCLKTCLPNLWRHAQQTFEDMFTQAGCHNPSPRGYIVDRKFALSHRKFQLISTHLLLSQVDLVKLSKISYFFLNKINSFERGIYFLWKSFIKFNLCYDKYVFKLPQWLEILTIFTREYRVLTGNLDIVKTQP